MQPRMLAWAHAAATRGGRCNDSFFNPFEAGPWRHFHRHGDDLGGGAFGVRRPLRFLAWKLELKDEQVAQFATLLNDLKTERAQSAVDDRRALAGFAAAVAGDGFDAAQAEQARRTRTESGERLQGAIITALQRMHAVLEPEQRQRLAYLIRTGSLLL